MLNNSRFTKGDHIRLTDKRSGATMTGTALSTRGFTGWASFFFIPDGISGGQKLALNLNDWDTEILFKADIARSLNPDGSDWEDD
jgi:hypothetical protein